MKRANVSIILLVAAIVIFVIAALVAFGAIVASASVIGLIALGLICWAGSQLA